MPLKAEVPQVDWPVIEVAGQQLVVRWTFYAQWLCSKRHVPLKDLTRILAAREPEMLDVLVESFAAAVAENYTAAGEDPPTAEQWAAKISALPNANEKFGQITQSLLNAILKVMPAPKPQAGQAVATTGSQPN